MRLHLAWMLLLAAGCSDSGASKAGGTLPWRGKDAGDLQPILAEAKERGKAMMLYFSSEG